MYCTAEDVTSVPSLRWQDIDEPTILKYIGQAEMIIDIHCRSHGFTAIPFSPVPPEINMICVKIAICQMLHEVKGLMGVDDANIYAIQDYCKLGMDILHGLKSGNLLMTEPIQGEANPGCGVYVEGIDWTAIDDPEDVDYKKPWEL